MEVNLEQILEAHAAWLWGEAGGVQADLRGVDLHEADLSGANLSGADLRDANLAKANLHRADLRGVDLRGANLRWADLHVANLIGADLRGANLRWADLCEADLCEARLPAVPVVQRIDAAILTALDAGGRLDMRKWGTRGITQCRASWAVTLAGDAGRKLEEELGTCTAAALIYAASRPNKRVPDFFASNKDALADLRRCAAEQV